MPLTRNLILVAALAAGAFMAGYLVREPSGSAAKTAVGKVLYYRCPMHPSYRSDRPGTAPCCGMDLEPVTAGDDGASRSGDAAGTVRVSVEKQQLIGMKTARAARAQGTRTVRVLGRVAADETRVHRVTALADGVVREVGPFTAGNLVMKDDFLARYFVSSQEVYSAIQSYFLAMSSMDQRLAMAQSEALVDQAKSQIRLAEEVLEAYGITAKQMAELAKTRMTTRDIAFHSPVTGLVLARDAALGQRLERGSEIFRVADISRVWVLADLFENESGLFRPGAAARVLYQKGSYPAVVSAANQFDAGARTLRVRLEMDNPGLMLRPDMFVDVEVEANQPEGISLPADAVLDSGRRRVVFVTRGEGAFEPREVKTGQRFGDRVQVLEGVREGEEVVVSGLFLLDSESRLQLAAQSAAMPAAMPEAHSAMPGAHEAMPAAGAAVDPVCGMRVNPKTAQYHSEHMGHTVLFCSRDCKVKFDGNPAQFAARM